MKNIIFTMTLVMTLLLNSGCFLLLVGAGAGAGTAHVMGKDKANLEATLKQVDTAILKAGKNLDYFHMSHKLNEKDGIYIYRDKVDRKVEIKTKEISATVTKITITIGVFGNEEISHTILLEVQKNL
jgi:hypothetical protein